MKKLIIAAFFLACAGTSVWAAPARRTFGEITLENGTTIQAQSCGDEHFHYWQSNSGEYYVKAANGKFRRLSQEEFTQTEQVAKQQRVMRSPGRKHFAPKVLTILVNFADIQFRPENTPAEMDSMLNGVNYTYYKSYGSVRKYFQDQSFGQHAPHFDIVAQVTLPEGVSYYGGNNTYGKDTKPADMVFKACSIASQINGINFAEYDSDNDGNIDLVAIIYAGCGENDANGLADSLIWAANWRMGPAVSSGSTSLPSSALPSAYTFQGKTIDDYIYCSELNYYDTYIRPAEGYGPDNPLRAGIGTFCHEYCHVIGLPDLYDTTKGVNHLQHLTPLNWHLMDQGTYNKSGYVPPAFAPMERWWLEWNAPTRLSDSANITLPADNQTAYYISANDNDASATSTDTIYYLENRQRTGWDQGLYGHGLLVWRVVFNAGAWSGNYMNNTANKPRYTYIPADGNYFVVGASDYAGDTYPGLSNITTFTPFVHSPITDIQETDGVITFKFRGGREGTALPNVKQTEEQVEAIYSLTGAYMGTQKQNLPAGLYLLRTNDSTKKIIIR